MRNLLANDGRKDITVRQVCNDNFLFFLVLKTKASLSEAFVLIKGGALPHL
ncbi:hypothetical protein H6F42_03000 [Pseudanabaena sp. FACHB-1998]|nr:hypothetical protein [Pseudanabaena sp. FACHB-1998]